MPFLLLTQINDSNELQGYYVRMKKHPDPKKQGVYLVDTDNEHNTVVFSKFPTLRKDTTEYGLNPENSNLVIPISKGGRRISKKRSITHRRRRSSKARKSSKSRTTRRKY
jgi:hypothetical protein